MRRLFLFILPFCISVISGKEPKVEYDGKALNVPLNADGTVQLLQHWTDQAFSGLLAAVAEKQKKLLGIDFHDDFESCSKKAVSVNKHAKCVSKLLKDEYLKKSINPNKSFLAVHSFKQQLDDTQPISRPMTRFEKLKARNLKLTNRYSNIARINSGDSSDNSNILSKIQRGRRLNQLNKRRRRKFGSKFGRKRFSRLRFHRRIRRDTALNLGKNIKVVSRANYNLYGSEGGMTPFGMVAKMLTKQVLAVKNKTEMTNWKAAVHHVRLAAKEKKDFEAEQNKRAKDEEQDDIEKFAFRGLKHEGIDIEKVLDDPKELQRMAKENRKQRRKMPMGKVLDLLRQGVKLGYSVTGQNTTNFDEKTLKVASPRFLSLIPEDEKQTANLLSPSLFSLHNEGSGVENLTSLPSLIKSFNGADQQSWLNLIIEAAGVEDQAARLDSELKNQKKEKYEGKHERKKSYEEKNRASDGTPLYFTKENVTKMYGDYETRKITTWEKLLSTYTKEQMREMNETGYAVLTKEQLYLLYGPESPFNSSEALTRLTSVNATAENMHKYIEHDIHRMAEMKSFEIRQKDIVLSPIVNSPLVLAAPQMSQPIVLSPVVFSPVVLTPAVLGPVILSPWLFIPVILSPRVLSPLIVNPLIFSPIVLSPLVLHPLILSPGVFNPIVLSPLVLSPFILSPQVFTPVILSPMVLNPLILNPMVGSPLVLSPFVLSPLILSPQALFAVVLSPYTLSPLILSPLIGAEVILSPSSLS
uniref:Uncharacterized protein n=1 Tax=Panagrolaimus sp. PS1159 TaxID=55785 RepID=A0AC35FF69_9BILA